MENVFPEEADKCTCETQEYEEHQCPYQQEMNNDDDYMCTCCPFCTQRCLEDI